MFDIQQCAKVPATTTNAISQFPPPPPTPLTEDCCKQPTPIRKRAIQLHYPVPSHQPGNVARHILQAKTLANTLSCPLRFCSPYSFISTLASQLDPENDASEPC